MKPVKFPFRKRSGNAKVTVYRHANPLRPGGVEFKVAFYGAEGKRRFASFTDFDAAHAKAKEILALAARGELDAIKLTKLDLADHKKAKSILDPFGVGLAEVAQEWAKAREMLQAGGVSVLDAVKWYAERNQVGIVSKLVSEVLDEMIESKRKANKRERTLQDLQIRCGRFAKFCPGYKLNMVTPGMVEDFFKTLDLSPQSCLNYYRTLDTMFRWAAGRHYLPKEHGLLGKIDKPVADDAEITIWTAGEIRRLLDAAPAGFLPALALQSFAGIRSAEVERLPWENIDLPGGRITIGPAQAKRRSRRTVPISPNLADWLAPYAGAGQTGLIWKHGHQRFYQAQQQTAAAAGLKWRNNACRHSYISYRVAQTRNIPAVACDAGNSPAMVKEHYDNQAKATPAEAEAYFAVRPAHAANVVPFAMPTEQQQ